MRDDKFTTTTGIVNLHPTKETHWVMLVNEFYYDSVHHQINIMSFINNGFYSEYQIQKNDSYSAAYFLLFYLSHNN